MSTMPSTSLRRGWNSFVRSAVLHVIALAHDAIVTARGTAVDIVPVLTDIERLKQEIALLREEARIKDARLLQLPPQRRPHYPPVERLAILEIKAARGWSLVQTARAFLVTPQTISQWMHRLDEQGPDALVQTPAPVNKFPQLVAYLVTRLRVLCPTLGKQKIAELLARAGLHLGTTTVGRMLKPSSPPASPPKEKKSEVKARVVTAKRSNHVWHVDLTAVPITSGYWVPWPPLALPQCWPFCWWVAVVIDHYSRRVMGAGVFRKQPTSEQVRAFLGRAFHAAGTAPKHLICDRGSQFTCSGFRAWLNRRDIRVRYGAIGKHGSIAVVERLIKTLKQHCRWLPLVTLTAIAFRRELNHIVSWYNDSRPHTTLRGCTPNEVYFRRFPAHRKPRHEPRARWPRGAPCAGHWALVRGKRGVRLELKLEFQGGHQHLPLISLRRAA